MSTTYETIQYGSSGQSVRDLQQLLKNQGYDIAVDGQFGSQTRQAVLDYQKKHNLAVDGVVGSQTWGQLHGTGKASQSAGYTPSQSVISAKEHLDDLSTSRPGAYESAYEDDLSRLYEQIINRPAFSYDLNGDPMYRQYRQQYAAQGRLAMEDTMGRASGLTGGYGSSYGQAVGQQAYHSHLQGLNDMVPQLYELALERYARQGQGLMDQYELIRDLETQSRDRYNAAYDHWFREYTHAQDQYNEAQEIDFDQYLDMLAYWQKQAKLEAASSSSSGSSGGSRSSGSSRNSASTDNSSGADDGQDTDGDGSSGRVLTRQQVKAMASDYMRLGFTEGYGSVSMRRWMGYRGIGEEYYADFYAALQAMGYRPRDNSGSEQYNSKNSSGHSIIKSRAIRPK